jgi:Fe-S-cluster-containing dehydrogenase component
MCFERIDAGLLPACVQGCVTGALQLIDLNEFEETNAVQYPAGYPVMKRLNPSTRFILPKMPRQIRG